MVKDILEIFKITNRENQETISTSVTNNIPFRGTNLYVLVFAILIASIGLNVNSTAVIIGAMLISPLMGPIIGIGFSLGVGDLRLMRSAAKNYIFSIAVALLTSTIYFLISPLSEAHSELLARITPTIWDVLIALFGGFAGIIANASKEKGNVLPGVAIATALMPPLCTAGYGLAHWEWKFILGAFYLFLVNSVYIGAATFIVVQLLKFPLYHDKDTANGKRIRRIVTGIVILITIPSLIIAYRVVKDNQFENIANTFVEQNGKISGNYLLDKKIDAPNKIIYLTYGGNGVSDSAKKSLLSKLTQNGIPEAKLEINEGFSLHGINTPENPSSNLVSTIEYQQHELNNVRTAYDSFKLKNQEIKTLITEAKAEHPLLDGISLAKYECAVAHSDDTSYLAYIQFEKLVPTDEKTRMIRWLQVKLKGKKLKIVISP
jgi:uncharacterized hydrophobic protein (TIGR00271 family)